MSQSANNAIIAAIIGVIGVIGIVITRKQIDYRRNPEKYRGGKTKKRR
jgi:capsular polysaccharide biosynthesis protein